MRWLIRIIIPVLLTLLSFIVILSAGFIYLIVTPSGAKLLVRCFKYEFLSQGRMHIGHCEGSLHHGFVLKDVKIMAMPFQPESTVRIQEIKVRIPVLTPSLYQVDIFNARLFVPECDPIVFTGKIHAGQISGNFYSNFVDIYQFSRFWAIKDIVQGLRGFITNADAQVMGTIFEPRIKGHFQVDTIRYRSVVLKDGVGGVDLTFNAPLSPVLLMSGEMTFDKANVIIRKIKLDLSESKAFFKGNVLNPLLDIHLGAKVEDMYIHLVVKDELLKPQLTVTSDPPMLPQDALRVLFTGNAFGPVNSPFDGITSGELARDFLNYSLNDINSQQQVGLKTKLTDRLKLGLEMDQRSVSVGDTNTFYSRKISGELDLNDNMSLNILKGVLPQENYMTQLSQGNDAEDETQIYLQYKKRF
ncbi:MAG: translocation/assembly module TamB domain-containing protein [Candidatus Omnitrophica bacterium]|nr:translocation/assembly module TamB domain-containing protein [Candidatus Omnitrophota bacterium]